MRATNKLGPMLALFFVLGLTGCTESAEDAPLYLERAQAYVEQSNIELAQVELNNALRLDPTLVDALQLQWDLHEQQQQLSELLKTLDQLLTLTPQNLTAKLRKAELLLFGQSTALAKPEIEQALALAPDNIKALNLHTAWLLQSGATATAVDHSKSVLQRAEANVTSHVLAVMAQAGQGQFEPAQKLLNEGLKMHPEDVLLLVLQTRLTRALGKFADLPKAYEILLTLHPGEVGNWWELARFYIRDDQYDQAINVMRRAVSVNPESERAHYLLADILANSRRGDAISQIEALLAERDASSVRFLLADLYRRNNQYSQAQSHLATIMSYDDSAPAALDARTALAQIELNQGNSSAADNHVEIVLQTDANHTGAQILKALIEIRSGQGRESIERLRRVLRDAPDDDQALALLGRAYLLANAPDLARDSFKSALAANPLNAAAGLQIALMHRQDQEPNKVIEVLKPFEHAQLGNAEIERELLRAQLATQDWEGARRLVRQGVLGEGNPTLQPLIEAAILQGRGRWSESVAPLRNILKAHPQSEDAATALISAYEQLGQADAAIAYLKQHRSEFPQYPWATKLLFNVLVATYRIAEAKVLLNEQLTGPNASPDHYGWMAMLQRQTNDTTAAIETLQEGTERFPDAAGLHQDYGLLLDSAGRYGEASESYRRALQLDSNALISANNLAVIYARDSATIERARELAESLRDTSNPNFIATLGWTCLLTGDLNCAIDQLESAVEQLPELAEPHYHLGKAYRQANQESRGIAMLRKAAELLNQGSEFEEADALRSTLNLLDAS